MTAEVIMPKWGVKMEEDAFKFAEENRAYKATPTARKIAENKGIFLGEVAENKHKRIYKEDVLEYKKGQQNIEKRENLTGLKKAVAQRVVDSWSELPHVTLTLEVDMTEALVMVNKINDIIEDEEFKVSPTDILLKTLANCLKEYPIMNAYIEGEEIVYGEEINIGLAVNVEGELVIPVLKNVARKGLKEIIKEKMALTKKARKNNLTREELMGSNIALSNLGMYGVDVFTPIINTPGSGILGIGKIEEKPAVVNGEVKIRPMMWLSLSLNHRLINGAPAAEFLSLIKKILETPELLIV